jgi:hypothetical protein
MVIQSRSLKSIYFCVITLTAENRTKDPIMGVRHQNGKSDLAPHQSDICH